MKNLFALSLAVVSLNTFATAIDCGFTEPFYSIEIDVEKKTFKQVEIDWSYQGEGEFPFITTDFSKDVNLVSSSKNGLATIEAYSVHTKKKVFSAVLNFQGSDGMSDLDFAWDARHGKNWGGCSTSSLKAIDNWSIAEDVKAFYENVKAAIPQCYARAYAPWTSQASEYKKDQTVFSVLYATEVVPGEPGEVSSTFSSAENDELAKLVDGTKPIPYSGGDLKAHKRNKIEFCDAYGKFLLNRFPDQKI
jgi:hypothetical protein